MNTNFLVNMGCPFCVIVKEALGFVNLSLRPSQRINDLDIMRGKPKNMFMEEMFDDPDPGNWFVPVVVMDKPGLRRVYNSYVPERTHRILVQGAWDTEHSYILLSQYSKGGRFR